MWMVEDEKGDFGVSGNRALNFARIRTLLRVEG